MYLNNVLKSGDFLVPVPVGLPMTIQYNFAGSLEKIYLRFGNDRIDVTNELLDAMRKTLKVPAVLHVKKGITLIRGVLYTAELSYDSGHLPYCVEESLKSRFLKSPGQFNFFAATWDSSEAHITGPTATKQMLAMSKFKLLPGWLVPSGLTRGIVRGWVTHPSYTFNPDMITNYVIFRGEDVKFVSTQMKQFSVTKVQKYVDENGFVKARVYASASAQDGFIKHISVDYSDVIRWDIQANTLVVLDENNQIILSKPTTDKKRTTLKNQLVCSYCGKAFIVPKEGEVICPDIHCTSRLLIKVRQFMNVVGLSAPSTDELSKLIQSKQLTCVSDLFSIPGYTDEELSLNLSYTRLLRSLVPFTLIPKDDVIRVFADSCANNVDMFLHYCEHPSSAIVDLQITHRDFPKLCDWLSDNFNLVDIQTLMNTPQITFNKSGLKFEGAPMFRGKTIYLTGEFIRGPQSDIATILSNYGAKVLLEFNDIIDCVIVGGLHEGVNGVNINQAKAFNIPVLEEEDFFKQYEIDADIKANLE